MKNDTFDYLCDNALRRAIDDVLECIPEESRKSHSLSFKERYDEKKRLIYEEYVSQRDNVKAKFFDVGDNGENLMDIHKVDACITLAVMRARVFDYKFTGRGDLPMFYSNYAVAFLMGMHVLYLCMLSDLEKEDKTLADRLRDRATLSFPETNEGHDSYALGRVKTLALNDMYAVDFDILTYADMLFWIEKYNRDELAKS